MARLAYQNGVSITTGTDWFEPLEKELLPHTHEELSILVNQAGLTPMDAIVAASKNGAEALGIISERGTLEVNKAAALVVLNKNPLEDINHTRTIRFTLKNGVFMELKFFKSHRQSRYDNGYIKV